MPPQPQRLNRKRQTEACPTRYPGDEEAVINVTSGLFDSLESLASSVPLTETLLQKVLQKIALLDRA